MKLLRIKVVIAACVLLFVGSALRGDQLAPTSPEKVGLSAAKLREITRLLERNVEAKRIAGGVALVVRHGQVAYRASVGSQDVETNKPMKADTIFRIASMTKPITSVAVMMLCEQGKLALSDPISKYIPEFGDVRVLDESVQSTASFDVATVPTKEPVTIHHLLTHTSGIVYGFSGHTTLTQLYQSAGVSDGLVETEGTIAQNTARIAQLPLRMQPGTAWQYGLSTDVLGRVVEVASGMSLEEFFRTRIFEPLGMHDTHFFLPADKVQRLASLYTPDANTQIQKTPIGPVRTGSLTYSATFHFQGPKTYYSGGAGLVSTVDDYARFLQMLFGGGRLGQVRLLKPETVRQMTQNQIGDLDIAFRVHGNKFGYGFGVLTEEAKESSPASLGSYSWGGIFHTFFWVDPKLELIGIVMTQLYPFGHSTLWADFQKRVYDAVIDVPEEKAASLGPRSGAIYKEFAAHQGGDAWRVTDSHATAAGAQKFLPNPVLTISVDDLEGAVRAEALLDRWGGHPRTSAKQIRFNGHAWITVPELRTTPDGRCPEKYYSQDNPIVEVPLDHLRVGENTFEGTCSTIENYNWGQWGLYSLILWVYYSPASKPQYATARIVAPTQNDELPDNPQIRLAVDDPSQVARIDLLAWYEGLDEDGDGTFRDWHQSYHQPSRGAPAEIAHHVATMRQPPFETTWDTTWVPDQPPAGVRLVARIQDRTGLWRVSQVVRDLTLLRKDSSVKQYRAADVPERFGVRQGRETAACTIPISNEPDLKQAVDVRLAVSTWHGWDGSHSPLQLNDYTLKINGKNHHYDFDLHAIPVTSLKPGVNHFRIHSTTEHHMLEILWPGPILLVRYQLP